MMRKILSVLMLLGFLAGCQEKAEIPKPLELTRSSNGHYCQMIIVDHPGPKAQVFEKGSKDPLWFSSVRDAISYMRMPGEAQNVTAIYVHDMARAEIWDKPPNNGIWIDAIKAFYVIESEKRGGMGAKETVPFLTREQADKFAVKFGGSVITYQDLPLKYILSDDHLATDDDPHKEHKKKQPDS